VSNKFVKAVLWIALQKHLLGQILAWIALQFSVNESEHSSHEYTL